MNTYQYKANEKLTEESLEILTEFQNAYLLTKTTTTNNNRNNNNKACDLSGRASFDPRVKGKTMFVQVHKTGKGNFKKNTDTETYERK